MFAMLRSARIVIAVSATLTFILVLGCAQFFTGCWEEDLDCAFLEAGDEAFTEDCGMVIFADGYSIVSHTSCSPLVETALGVTSDAVWDYSADPAVCGDIPTWLQWPCFRETGLVDNLGEGLMCGYCPEWTSDDTPPHLCWIDPSEWLPDELQGVVTQLPCAEVPPGLGSLAGYPLPLDCSEGETFVCLGGNDRCSCTCDDETIGSLDSLIDPWWQQQSVPMPPSSEWEAGCTGCPLTWDWDAFGGGGYVGSSLTLNGEDYPGDCGSALYHEPLWRLDVLATAGGVVVSQTFVDTALAFPGELLYEAHVVPARTGLEIDYCGPTSICARAGFAIGDVLVGGSVDDNGDITVEYDRAGRRHELAVEVTP